MTDGASLWSFFLLDTLLPHLQCVLHHGYAEKFMVNLTFKPFLQQKGLSEQQMHHFKGQMHVCAVPPPNQLLISFKTSHFFFCPLPVQFLSIFLGTHYTTRRNVHLVGAKQHFMPSNLKILCFCDRLQVKKCLRKI